MKCKKKKEKNTEFIKNKNLMKENLKRKICRTTFYTHTYIQLTIICVFSKLYAYSASYMRIQQIMCVFSKLYAYSANYVRIQQIICVFSKLA